MSVKDVVSNARGKLEDLHEGIQGGLEDGREKALDVLSDVRKSVRRNPGTAMLVTFAVGIVIGMALSPRRRS